MVQIKETERSKILPYNFDYDIEHTEVDGIFFYALSFCNTNENNKDNEIRKL